jgi:predicted DNA-binding protein
MVTTINFRISDQTKQELQFISMDKNIKVSNLVREIITEYLENYYNQELGTNINHNL